MAKRLLILKIFLGVFVVSILAINMLWPSWVISLFDAATIILTEGLLIVISLFIIFLVKVEKGSIGLEKFRLGKW